MLDASNGVKVGTEPPVVPSLPDDLDAVDFVGVPMPSKSSRGGRGARDGRWPLAIRALFIVGAAAALWAMIYLAIVAL